MRRYRKLPVCSDGYLLPAGKKYQPGSRWFIPCKIIGVNGGVNQWHEMLQITGKAGG